MIGTQAEALTHAQELLHRRELDAALKAFTYAETLGAEPDQCCAGRWMAYMLSGAFACAWAESDVIRQRGAPDPNRFWQGEDLGGKRVILRCLHGIGDAVQFLRYVPALRSLTANLIVEVPPALVDLSPYFAGVEEVITWGPDAPLITPQWEVQVEINELPYLFRTTPEQLPVATGYLHLPGTALKDNALRATSPTSLRVGLVWASSNWKTSRSIPFELLHPILGCGGCEFWNMQGGSERHQWSRLEPRPYLHNAEACKHSVLAFASTLAHFDLIITSDTLAAHLAGALGVPAWVMLERASDWRWQHARDDSPWYPSLRLFRQHRDGDWASVVASIADELSTASLRRMVA